ncbi:MAG: hypothetical protein HZC54_24945 [Verrucomicrobia bacterium]|nr:hypothetical protein [Verrucomicrobiota bacterium]
MAANGQLRLAKVPEGATVQLVKVDGDRVEVIYQGLTLRMPAIATDLASRAHAPRPAAALAPSPASPATTTAEPPAPSQSSPDAKTFIGSSMSDETFKAAGLAKLSPAELQVLDGWFLDIVLTTKRAGASQQNDPLAPVLGKKAGVVERALLVKNFNGERVLVQRTNGEKWMLRAKTWCRWSWRYEGRYVCLVFGPTMSQLINDYGETYDFWTDKPVE